MTDLTIVVPTRNRAALCANLLRFFRASGVAHRIVVADESGPDDAEKVRAACEGIATYRHFDPATEPSAWLRFAGKALRVLEEVETPFVLMVPDDDVTFPRAIDACLAHLRSHPDFVAAHGYWLHFQATAGSCDIRRVASFTPTIGEDGPLERLYHLMRRYQPFVWAVFRVAAFAEALRASTTVNGVMFQEIMFMNAAISMGKLARVRQVFGLRGIEPSLTPLADRSPFHWFLDRPENFFATYRHYRSSLAQYLRDRGIDARAERDLDQLLDVIHGIWLMMEADPGVMNHFVELMLGYDVPPLESERTLPVTDAVGDGDRVRLAESGRRYIWRRAVLEAEPRDEIAIAADEVERVERQLELYFAG